MDDNRVFDLFQKLADKLQENTDALKNMLANHESRLAVLETKNGDGFKSTLIMWLLKGLLVALGIIATSAGAASVLKPILGM